MPSRGRKGGSADLGALPGNNSSAVYEVDGNGVGVGFSETGVIDPNTGYQAAHAVRFKNGLVTDLGTLPGGYENFATAINDKGQIAGFASNGVTDPYSMLGLGTQTRSVVWQNGTITDIGTLGGPDALMATMNARGQVAGQSYTNATPNASSGVPTADAFLWEKGQMRDLGTLGGTRADVAWMNGNSQVVGESTLAGDEADASVPVGRKTDDRRRDARRRLRRRHLDQRRRRPGWLGNARRQ